MKRTRPLAGVFVGALMLAASASPRAPQPEGRLVSRTIRCARATGDMRRYVRHHRREYVGHDEPSVLFKSDVPDPGNDMTYQVKLPKEPQGPAEE